MLFSGLPIRIPGSSPGLPPLRRFLPGADCLCLTNRSCYVSSCFWFCFFVLCFFSLFCVFVSSCCFVSLFCPATPAFCFALLPRLFVLPCYRYGVRLSCRINRNICSEYVGFSRLTSLSAGSLPCCTLPAHPVPPSYPGQAPLPR